jgi:hypothetical protein
LPAAAFQAAFSGRRESINATKSPQTEPVE